MTHVYVMCDEKMCKKKKKKKKGHKTEYPSDKATYITRGPMLDRNRLEA